MRRITANLAPADLKKEGPAYDLPIAVGILIATEQIAADVSKTVFLGELSLDGALRHTSGILPMVGLAHQQGFTRHSGALGGRQRSLSGRRYPDYSLDSLAELASYLAR